jgi:hypothetical protein
MSNSSPEYMREYLRAWRKRNPTYHRDWKRTRDRLIRQKKAAMAASSATLHELTCAYRGPRSQTRCTCRVVLVRP